MIPVVEQDGYFRQAVGFILEVIDVFRQHLNQALVVRHIRLGAVDKAEILEYRPPNAA